MFSFVKHVLAVAVKRLAKHGGGMAYLLIPAALTLIVVPNGPFEKASLPSLWAGLRLAG